MSGRLLAALLFLGCGGSDSGDSGTTTPIAAKPLSGTVAGKPFEAKSALAKKSHDAEKKSIAIYSTAATCTSRPANAYPHVLAVPVWEVGAAQNAFVTTFMLQEGSTIVAGIAESGQFEVVSAPKDVGATGKIRLRATYEDNTVEGEIDVAICE
jgi:hypothetical protein